MLNSDVVLYLSREIVYVNDPYPYLTVATNNKHLVVYFESFTLFVSALYLIMAQQHRHNLPFFKSDAYKYHQFRIEGGKRAAEQPWQNFTNFNQVEEALTPVEPTTDLAQREMHRQAFLRSETDLSSACIRWGKKACNIFIFSRFPCYD